MKNGKKIISFFKKKYVWIPLLVVSIFLQLVGIAAMIGISSYQLKPKDGTFGSWQYSYELSEKAALDTWAKNSLLMQADPRLNTGRAFGEFRTWVQLSKDEQGKEQVKTLFGNGDHAIGSLYINGKKYSAQLYPQTGEITYDASESLQRSKWQWYNWMGLRPPQWYLDYKKVF